MDTSYDEDISQNPFFVEFQTEHPELLNQCIAEGWVLCVPRVDTVMSQIFTLQDFLGHILICNDELPVTHFMTLTDKTVRVVNKVISVEQNNNGLPSEIHILFEETFYTADKVKYKVWCIEFPLELEYTSKLHNISHCKPLCTLRDCIDFLWTESSGKEVLESMDLEIHQCKTILSQTQGTSLYNFRDVVGSLFTNCVQIVLKNRRLKERCKNCKNAMDNVKLAVETYMLHGIYKELFEILSTCTAHEDSSLNKIIRNLSDIHLQDLEVKQEFLDCIPVARKNLSLIQSYSTILGKVSCIRNTISTINKTSNKSNNDSNLYVSTDELLPILIFLVLKSGIPNWLAHLNFLKHFRFSVHKFFQSDESSFCISTLEAVIEQIKSGLFSSCPRPQSQCAFSDTDDSFELLGFTNENTAEPNDIGKECSNNLQYLFEQVKLSNIDRVKEILEQNKNVTLSNENNLDLTDSLNLSDLCLEDVFSEDSCDEIPNLCHPLCTCVKCCCNLLRSSPTVSSRDSHGFTVLHVASMHNKIRIIDLVLEMGADVDSTDNSGSTPLHYAASKGYQTAMLLLLHVGADFNKQNMDKNTPLHLACNNGHESCVKALIYFCEQTKNVINMQAINENGDTPLHLASKWGYLSTVRVLLENGAEPWMKNHKGKTPVDYSHSRLTSNLLLSVLPNMLEYVNVSYESDKKHSNIKSDVILLDLNDDSPFKSSSGCKTSLTPLLETVKPKTTVDIHHIERLFRAITFGDVKLACFYMNIDFDSNCNIDNSEKKKMEISLCHPLCNCVKCSGRKPSENNTVFNVNMCDSKGDTSLHVAVKHNRLEICDILLNNGANPSIKNNIGITPLHVAAKDNKVAIMKKLLKYSKNIKLRDSSGNTPLHLASKAGSIEAVRLLLKVEPYEEIRNFAHKTPLDEAKDQIHLTIIDLLEESLKKYSK